jgi:hypothetical protein
MRAFAVNSTIAGWVGRSPGLPDALENSDSFHPTGKLSKVGIQVILGESGFADRLLPLERLFPPAVEKMPE